MEKDYFKYNDGEEITKGAFRISASQLSKFFDQTSKWYREHLLGEEGFSGNTFTHLGNVVHAAIEMYSNSRKIDWTTIEAYINSIVDPEVDKQYIRDQMHYMVDTALSFVDQNMPTETEKFVFHEVLPGIGVGGSIDALRGFTETTKDGNIIYPQGVTIMDWKTTSAKTPPTTFSRNYWFQQMTYAWVLKQQGIDVEYIKLVFITTNETGRVSEKTGKPLKDYPSQVSVVTEMVTPEGLDIIEGAINVIADSVKTFQENPELRYLLAQDYRLKKKTSRKLTL